MQPNARPRCYLDGLLGCLFLGGKAMKARSRTGRKAGKSARDKAATRKHRRASPKTVSSRRSAMTTQKTTIARLARERDQALEREKATAEVLRVVSSSPSELRTVFRTILEMPRGFARRNSGSFTASRMVLSASRPRSVLLWNMPNS